MSIPFLNNVTVISTISTVNGNSDQWNSNWTTTNSNSSKYDSNWTSFNSNSSKYDSNWTSTNTNSGYWNSVYSSAKANSANWDSVYTSSKANSANWDSAYNNISKYDSNYTTTNTNSANWDSAYNNIPKYDSNWTTTNSNSGKWESVYTITNASSSSYIRGVDWSAGSISSSYAWNSVAYGNGVFVAVAIDYGIAYSRDGINWVLNSGSITTNYWTSVTFGRGLFVAVANAGSNRLMTSPDGINWTVRTVEGYAWTSVTYGNGLFVAVANGRVMTSPDGVTWTSVAVAATSWNSVTYGNGLYVAVSNTAGTPSAINRVMTSPDGVTWTIRTAAASEQWNSITYGNGIFVAVASSGTSGRVMTSPDGITWTSRAVSGGNWQSVAYGDGVFVAASLTSSGSKWMYSFDGITWVVKTGTEAETYKAAAYGNGLFVILANAGTNRALYSGRRIADETLDNIRLGGFTVTSFLSTNGIAYASGVYAGPNPSSITSTTPISAMTGMYVEPVSGYAGFYTNAPVAPVDVRGTMKFAASAAATSSTSNIKIQGNYAYVTNYGDASLMSYDLTQTTPISTGKISTASNPQGLYVNGKYAYVVTSNGSSSVFQIFEIQNPSSFKLLSTSTIGTTQNAFDVVVQGSYAFILTNNSSVDGYIIAYDISNPYAPEKIFITQTSTNGNSNGLTIQGKYLYWARGYSGTAGVYRMDVSDPRSKPAAEMFYFTGGAVNGAIVRGRYLYMNFNNQFGINNGTTTSYIPVPFVVGSTNLSNIILQGNYAYFSNLAGLHKIDVSNPSSPRLVASIASYSGTSTWPCNFDIQGRYAYLADRANNRINVLDLGGAYIQQLQAGGLSTDTAYIIRNAVIGNDLDVAGGAAFGQGFKSYKDSSVQGSLTITTASSSTSASNLFTVTSGSNASTIFIITSAGNIGIGTTAPNEKLTVVGTISTNAHKSSQDWASDWTTTNTNSAGWNAAANQLTTYPLLTTISYSPYNLIGALTTNTNLFTVPAGRRFICKTFGGYITAITGTTTVAPTLKLVDATQSNTGIANAYIPSIAGTILDGSYIAGNTNNIITNAGDVIALRLVAPAATGVTTLSASILIEGWLI